MEGIYRTDCIAADLCTEVPSSEAVVFLTVHLPYLIDDVLVVLDFVAHVLCVPVNT